MPVALLWIGGALAVGWASKNTADALGESHKLARWCVAGGAIYVGYRYARTTGAIK